MSTLTQIESAVAGLPTQDQWSLLTWLQGRLSTTAAAPVSNANPEWLKELRSLREGLSTGKPGTPVEQIISEIRS